MIRIAALALAAAPLALASPAAAEVEITSQGPVVRLSVTETVEAEPDIAEISAGVTTEARSAVEAMRANARQMSAVIERIRALGVEDEDIQTTGVSLNPQYDYNRNQPPVFRGYQVSNRVSVTLRDIDGIGPALDALVAAGATDLNGPNFSIDDDTAARAQARQAAIRQAQEMAMTFASATGYRDVRLLEIGESVAMRPPMPMMRQAAPAVVSADVSTPIEPGRVGSSVTLNVTYEMTR